MELNQAVYKCYQVYNTDNHNNKEIRNFWSKHLNISKPIEILCNTICVLFFKFKINSIKKSNRQNKTYPSGIYYLVWQIFVIVCFSLAVTNLRMDERKTFIYGCCMKYLIFTQFFQLGWVEWFHCLLKHKVLI